MKIDPVMARQGIGVELTEADADAAFARLRAECRDMRWEAEAPPRFRDRSERLAILDEQIAVHEVLLAELRRLREDISGRRRGAVTPELIAKRDDIAGTPRMADLKMSVRLWTCLANGLGDPVYLGAVAELSWFDLIGIPGLGRTSYCELYELCLAHGVWQRDDRRHWPPQVHCQQDLERWLQRNRGVLMPNGRLQSSDD